MVSARAGSDSATLGDKILGPLQDYLRLGGLASLIAGPADAVASRAANSAAACSVESSVLRTPTSYEVLFESPVNGTSRAAHRTAANKYLAEQLRNDQDLSRILDGELGGNVLQHMESGKSLLNPPGTVWHHPIDNSNTVQLLRTETHTAPSLQFLLHPNSIGGFGTHYGP